MRKRGAVEQLRDVAVPFFVARGLTSVGQAMPHAILTPLLLAKGLDLSQILLVQAVYSVSVLLMEFPSGIASDLMSRRIVFLISRVILCGYFLLVIYGDSFLVLALAWGLYGVADAAATGTLDAALVNNAKNRATSRALTNHRVSWLVRTENRSSFAGSIIGAVIGGVLYASIGVNIYFISVGAAILAMASIVLFFRIPEQHRPADAAASGVGKQFKEHIRATVDEMRRSEMLKHYVLLTILVQAFMQLHLQLWQALALEKGIAESAFIVLYVLFVGMSFLGSFVPAERVLTHRGLVGGGTVVFVACALLLVVLPHLWYLGVYCVLAFLLILLVNYSTYAVRSASSIERIGAVTSLVSICGRIGSILMLLIASALIRVLNPSVVVSVGFVVLTGVFLLWYAAEQRARSSVSPEQ